MMGPFTTREVATGFWLAVFLLWAVSHKQVRNSAARIVIAALHPKIALPVFLLALYTACVVGGLRAIGLWQLALLKDTVIWFLFSGLGLAFSLVTQRPDQIHFRRIARAQLNFLVFLEFFINAYTFHLALELILIPVLTLLVVLEVVAKHKDGSPQVAKLSSALQGIIGLGMFALLVARLIADFNTIQWAYTIREISLPVLLTFSVLPAIFLLVLYSKYELLFLRVGSGDEVEKGVKWRARWRLFRRLGLNLRKIEEFQRTHLMTLRKIQSRADLDRFLPPS